MASGHNACCESNCPRCSEPCAPSEAELERFAIAADDLTRFDFRHGSGCGDCRGTGYRGRKAVAEILNLNDELRELIIEKRPIRQLKEAAHRNGTRSLTEAALRVVANGETTLEELRRVTLSGVNACCSVARPTAPYYLRRRHRPPLKSWHRWLLICRSTLPLRNCVGALPDLKPKLPVIDGQLRCA
jgi:hypothetical protein